MKSNPEMIAQTLKMIDHYDILLEKLARFYQEEREFAITMQEKVQKEVDSELAARKKRSDLE